MSERKQAVRRGWYRHMISMLSNTAFIHSIASPPPQPTCFSGRDYVPTPKVRAWNRLSSWEEGISSSLLLRLISRSCSSESANPITKAQMPAGPYPCLACTRFIFGTPRRTSSRSRFCLGDVVVLASTVLLLYSCISQLFELCLPSFVSLALDCSNTCKENAIKSIANVRRSSLHTRMLQPTWTGIPLMPRNTNSKTKGDS